MSLSHPQTAPPNFMDVNVLAQKMLAKRLGLLGEDNIHSQPSRIPTLVVADSVIECKSRCNTGSAEVIR